MMPMMERMKYIVKNSDLEKTLDHPFNQSEREIKRVKEHLNFLTRATKAVPVNVQNIADYYIENGFYEDNHSLKLVHEKKIPSINCPWNFAWMEWKLDYDEFKKIIPSKSHPLTMASVINFNDMQNDRVVGSVNFNWREYTRWFLEQKEGDGFADNIIGMIEEKANRYMHIFYMAGHDDDLSDSVRMAGEVIFIDEFGDEIDIIYNGEKRKIKGWNPDFHEVVLQEGKVRGEFYDLLVDIQSVIVRYTNCFSNTKNAEIIDNNPSEKLNIKRKKKNKPEKISYKTIHIQSLETALHQSKSSKRTGKTESLPLHICRGHFADYRKNGLFGKYKGIFWFDMHLRGKKSVGEIKTDYVIEAPKP